MLSLNNSRRLFIHVYWVIIKDATEEQPNERRYGAGDEVVRCKLQYLLCVYAFLTTLRILYL